ncbi:CLUMA_CG006634, isoform A [Clunio marinus]|uniref:CLUMA_CG006634, isoform A n=1 Tax=Clunio marinus TaxID=568069 RepID=A0A1J1HYC8_9DIPT|nr:CLUMA_CG006634, isoform A [Clunio marinus]
MGLQCKMLSYSLIAILGINYFHDMKINSDYTECKSEDLDPFGKCEPVDCALKYFGRRNFFNSAYSKCETAVTCHDTEVYDYDINECRYSDNIF